MVWPAPKVNGEKTIRSAAVLVPLIDHADGLTVLLTQRTSSLPDHAGQVAFPGGQVEPVDQTAEDTALREAHEEVGLHPRLVEPVGRLSPRDTRTGFRVMPVVGLVRPSLETRADPGEVEHIFEVPLAEVADGSNFKLEPVETRGVTREYWVMKHDSFFIWGLTARILRELSIVLRQS